MNLPQHHQEEEESSGQKSSHDIRTDKKSTSRNNRYASPQEDERKGKGKAHDNNNNSNSNNKEDQQPQQQQMIETRSLKSVSFSRKVTMVCVGHRNDYHWGEMQQRWYSVQELSTMQEDASAYLQDEPDSAALAIKCLRRGSGSKSSSSSSTLCGPTFPLAGR